eukprot:UN03075
MFQVRPQEGAKTLPLSSRLLMFAHSNVIDFMLYDVVSAAANGIMRAYKIDEKYHLVNDFVVTPSSRREDIPYPGDDEEDKKKEDEDNEDEDVEQDEDDEEEQLRRIEWYAEQKRLRDEEDAQIQPDPLKREVTTPSFALSLRTASPWILYSLLRCVHPAYDAHQSLLHVVENIITAPEVTIYSNTPFTFNDNSGIGSCGAEANALVDDNVPGGIRK